MTPVDDNDRITRTDVEVEKVRLGKIFQLRVVQGGVVAGPDDWRLAVAMDGLFAILNDARDLEHARQLAGEALVATSEGDAA
jgi:hypothetical protein